MSGNAVLAPEPPVLRGALETTLHAKPPVRVIPLMQKCFLLMLFDVAVALAQPAAIVEDLEQRQIGVTVGYRSYNSSGCKMRTKALVIFILLVAPLHPQTCGPSGSILRILDQLQSPDDMRLSATERRARKVELLQNGFKISSDDVFLHEAYQNLRTGDMEADRPPVIEEYERLLDRHPNDPVYLYLAASAQVGRRNTRQAISRLEQAIELSPSFGLPHLLLAQIYSAQAHADAIKVKEHSQRFENVCPESVRTFPTLRWSKDPT